jgi:hypothetical protein
MTTARGATHIDVFLATLEHPDIAALTGFVDGVTLDGKLRVANWRHNFTSRGDVFAPGFLRVKPPRAGDRRGILQLAIDNVDERVKDVVKALTGKATLVLEQVYAHDPDTVRNQWTRLELKLFETDARFLTGSFGPPPTEGRFMGITINAADFPGAFG